MSRRHGGTLKMKARSHRCRSRRRTFTLVELLLVLVILATLAAVSRPDFEAWSEAQQMAFLINLYNAATLQLIRENYPVKSIKETRRLTRGPWDRRIVRLFGEKISLNNLEHDILRKKYKEPRLHMVLVCAAKGCPPLRSEAYRAARLEAQLTEQSRIYLASPAGMRIDRPAKRLYLSAIFKWYGGDFPSLTDFAETYSGKSLTGLKLGYLDYDWSLNDL